MMPSASRVSRISKSEVFWPFIPENMTPDQFADFNHSSVTRGGPEKALMMAVLEDAIMRFTKYVSYLDSEKKKSWLRFRELQKWFESRDTAWLYSFERICETLDLDSDYLRRGLARAMQNSQQVQMPPRIRYVLHTRRISSARVRPAKKRGSKFTTFFVG